jgi:hypothetical protein
MNDGIALVGDSFRIPPSANMQFKPGIDRAQSLIKDHLIYRFAAGSEQIHPVDCPAFIFVFLGLLALPLYCYNKRLKLTVVDVRATVRLDFSEDVATVQSTKTRAAVRRLARRTISHRGNEMERNEIRMMMKTKTKITVILMTTTRIRITRDTES